VLPDLQDLLDKQVNQVREVYQVRQDLQVPLLFILAPKDTLDQEEHQALLVKQVQFVSVFLLSRYPHVMTHCTVTRALVSRKYSSLLLKPLLS